MWLNVHWSTCFNYKRLQNWSKKSLRPRDSYFKPRRDTRGNSALLFFFPPVKFSFLRNLSIHIYSFCIVNEMSFVLRNCTIQLIPSSRICGIEKYFTNDATRVWTLFMKWGSKKNFSVSHDQAPVLVALKSAPQIKEVIIFSLLCLRRLKSTPIYQSSGFYVHQLQFLVCKILLA